MRYLLVNTNTHFRHWALGIKYAAEHYEELISGMADGEEFKFVSHSEGYAFAACISCIKLLKNKTSLKTSLFINVDKQ